MFSLIHITSDLVSVARVMAERELEYARELKEMASRVRHPILKVLLKGIVRSIVFSMRLYWNFCLLYDLFWRVAVSCIFFSYF